MFLHSYWTATFEFLHEDQHMYYKRNIYQYTIAELQLKLSYGTWDSTFAENGVNKIFNSFLNTFLWHYYSSIPVIKTNKLLYHNTWITTSIRTSCKYKRELYIEYRKNKNLILGKYFKDNCQILTKVIKEAKRMEYDGHILNSNNVMRTFWKIIKELSKDQEKQGIQSVFIEGRCPANEQVIADAFNKHFRMIPDKINILTYLLHGAESFLRS